MKTADFDYELPRDLIAQQPLADRAGARMMVVDRRAGTIRHDQFRNLGAHLRAGDLLVLNDTKVIAARIWAAQPAVELLLVEKLDQQRWSALIKPARRAKAGTVLHFRPQNGPTVAESRRHFELAEACLTAVVEGTTDFGGRLLRFAGDVEAYLADYGAAPLPPYVKRPRPDAHDRDRYQTVFARAAGAIAAPTAGLHFTRELLARLGDQGIAQTFITLHVGLGTFRPVKTATVEEHQMPAERFVISADAAAAIAAARRVVAVGTTVVRALETVGRPQAAAGTTDIFIHPPYRFRMVDALLTNFHLPRSTLLMLVDAFAGRDLMRRAYAAAVAQRYRFFSYGDCLLIT